MDLPRTVRYIRYIHVVVQVRKKGITRLRRWQAVENVRGVHPLPNVDKVEEQEARCTAAA
jgi:hypothetical protein